MDADDGAYTIMLRPDALNTEKPGGYLLTVEAVSFRGSDTQVSLRAEDGTLWKKTCTGGSAWKCGETLSVQLQCEAPVLFSV